MDGCYNNGHPEIWMDTTADIQSRARDNMCAEMVPDKFHVNTVFVVFRSE